MFSPLKCTVKFFVIERQECNACVHEQLFQNDLSLLQTTFIFCRSVAASQSQKCE